MSTRELYDFDKDVIKNNFIITEKNLMIWPLVRWDILSYIQRKQHNTEIPHAQHTRLSLKNFNYVYNTLKYAPHRLKKIYNICYFCSARGRINNKNFNIDADYYSSLFSNTLVIDNSYRGYYYIPDNTNNFATGEYGILKAFLFGHIKRIFSKKTHLTIERFIEFLKMKGNFEYEFTKLIRNRLYNYYFGYDYYQFYLTNIFKKLNPQVIFVRNGTYGGYYSMLLNIAKENDIITGEFQHGIIYNDHMAYNYGDAIHKNKLYKKYLPDYILTFGEYWNDKINMPSKKITIGNPHYYESIKKYEGIKEQKNTILIISQGDITNRFVNIAKFLSKKLPDYRIVFKLHPGEVPFERRYKELYKYANIELVKFGDIYEYIARTEKIVACNSTAIFEALGFNKKLFILDDEITKSEIPKEIGIRFKENLELISNTKDLNLINNPEPYFNPKWKNNYNKFLREEIGLRLY